MDDTLPCLQVEGLVEPHIFRSRWTDDIYSAGEEKSLLPFSEILDSKFEKWLTQQESSGKQFTPEQKEWLVMIKDSITSSVSITIDDLDEVPFNQKGGRVKFYEIFGDDYEKILEELHEVLINQ